MSRAWRPRSGFSAHNTQGVDDGAFGDRAAIALRRHVVEDPGELLEVGYFAPHVGEVFERHQFGLLEETVGDVGPSGRQKNAGTAPWAPAGSRPALEQWQPLGEREHLDLTFLERLR